LLFPDPGPLPILPAPTSGEQIRILVPGLPPHKDLHFSIRNPKHRRYQRFMDLRNAAIAAMAGRAWYLGPVGLTLKLLTPEMEHSLGDFSGAVSRIRSMGAMGYPLHTCRSFTKMTAKLSG
jgi:hypothetical protein